MTQTVAADSRPCAEAPVWTQPTRIAFRYSFVYLLLYLLMNGNVTILIVVPVIGPKLQAWLAAPATQAALWMGQHWFHLTGVAARWHGGGSGDTALHYLQHLALAIAAVGIGTVWCTLDWRRRQYGLLLAWLRFLLRLTVGLGMLAYGSAKLFPLQMREPTFAILNNTYGNSSPMTLLWTMIGLHPGYEVVCGLVEMVAGVLILFRRTALLGAIFSGVVMTNVFLYNVFFDVPVKLYAGHLLLICGYLTLPDLPALARLFVFQEPARLSGVWVPPASRRPFRIATFVVEAYFLLGLLGFALVLQHIGWRRHLDAQKPTPLTGAWQVDTVASADPKEKPVSPEGDLWSVLYIDDRLNGFYRSSEGGLWRCNFSYVEAKQTIAIKSVGVDAHYRWSLPDADHLRLTRIGGKTPTEIALHRLLAPAHYPLLDRPFHWVNEWGYER